RYLHGDGKSGGCSGHQRALWTVVGTSADRISTDWAILVRAGALQAKSRLRTSAPLPGTTANQRFVTTDFTDLFRSDLSVMRSPVKISMTPFAVPTTGVTSSPT